jgi:hypothetical protein
MMDEIVKRGSSPEIISTWMASNAGNSWNAECQRIKGAIVELQGTSKGIHWNSSEGQDDVNGPLYWKNASAETKRQTKEAVTVWQAGTIELLANTGFSFSNQKTQTIGLWRNISNGAVERNGWPPQGHATVPRTWKHTLGYDCTSGGASQDYGKYVTTFTPHVPYHRVFNSYIVHRPNTSVDKAPLHSSQAEREFLASLHGLKTHFGFSKGGTPGSDLFNKGLQIFAQSSIIYKSRVGRKKAYEDR